MAWRYAVTVNFVLSSGPLLMLTLDEQMVSIEGSLNWTQYLWVSPFCARSRVRGSNCSSW